MNMDVTPQKIHISNFEDHTTVYYSTILIKGSISPFIPKTTINISTRNPKNEENRQFPKIINCGNFKILIELSLGENEIVISTNNSSKTLKINFLEKSEDYLIQPIYILIDRPDKCFQSPEDNNDCESACKRILTACKVLQCVIAEKLNDLNLGRKTFHIPKSGCLLFESKLKENEVKLKTPELLWETIAKEIFNEAKCLVRGSPGNYKYLGVLACTTYRSEKYSDEIRSFEEALKITEGHINLGKGDFALIGSGCLYTWPENIDEVIEKLEDITPVDQTKFLNNSNYRNTLGGCFATTLGSWLHELCHTLDLGHTRMGIMGQGFNNIQNMFLDGPATQKGCNTVSQNFIKPNLPIDTRSRTVSDDDFYFTNSNATLLSYHKWLNGLTSNKKSEIRFDPANNYVKSTCGLRVIEIRNVEDEMVLLDWVFVNKVQKFGFIIPEEALSTIPLQRVLLVVEDDKGELLKEEFNIRGFQD